MEPKKGIIYTIGSSTRRLEDFLWLLDQRNVKAIGTDTLSADYGLSADYPIHKIINGADRYIVENLCNLDQIPSRGALLHIHPLPIAGGTGAPAVVLSFSE